MHNFLSIDSYSPFENYKLKYKKRIIGKEVCKIF